MSKTYDPKQQPLPPAAIDNVVVVPQEVSVDATHDSAETVKEVQALDVTPFIAAEKARNGSGPLPR